MENNKTPSIRFKGFTDPWEQRKLGDLSESFEYGLNAAATEYDGKNKYIRITDIDDDSREFKQDVVTSPAIDLSNANNYKLSYGDILFARTGASVGKSYIYKNSDGLVYYAGFLIRAKIKKDYNPEFVFQNTLTNDYEKFINVTSMRSGQPGVNAQEYSQYQIMIPCKAEQDKISDYLRSLDTLITLHQRKYNKLLNVKKSMLEKMFPKNESNIPEIRFKGFTDPWEQRKLGELGEISTGSTPSTANSAYYSDDGMPWVTPTDINALTISDTPRKLSEEGAKVGRVVPANTILCTCIASIGKNTLLTAKGSFNQQINSLTPYDENDAYFLLTESEIWSNTMKRMAASGTMQIVNKAEFSELKTKVPSLAEQQQIGTYFKNLDNLITLHQRELEKLQNIKKFMLEKMFV